MGYERARGNGIGKNRGIGNTSSSDFGHWGVWTGGRGGSMVLRFAVIEAGSRAGRRWFGRWSIGPWQSERAGGAEALDLKGRVLTEAVEIRVG